MQATETTLLPNPGSDGMVLSTAAVTSFAASMFHSVAAGGGGDGSAVRAFCPW